MFHEQRRAVPDDVAALRAEYDDDLRAVVERHGVDHVAGATDVAPDALETLVAGDTPALTLREAAAIQALADGVADAETLVEMGCEHLLLGMTTAVLDVDTLASEVTLDLDGKEIQQKIERRAPMTFDEYVRIQHAIVRRQQ